MTLDVVVREHTAGAFILTLVHFKFSQKIFSFRKRMCIFKDVKFFSYFLKASVPLDVEFF